MANIRRKARELVAPLDVPSPWSIEALCAQVGERRGRGVRLEPRYGDGPSAVVRREADCDVISFRANHHSADHLIAHELGHLLAGDLDGPSDLAPLVDPDLRGAVASMSRACVYDDEQERLAEAVADLIMAGARDSQPTGRSRGAASTLRGFGEAMR